MTTPQEEARATALQDELFSAISALPRDTDFNTKLNIQYAIILKHLTRAREEGVESAIEAVKTAHALGHDRNRAEPDAQHLISREETLKALTALKSKP